MPTPPYYLWDHWYIAARSQQVKKQKPHTVTIMETRVYILGLRRFAHASWLTPLFNRFNRRVLDEDRAIIASQDPKHVTFGPGGDLLMRPDSVAKAYRALLARALDRTAPTDAQEDVC